jgi:hypothetical protein
MKDLQFFADMLNKPSHAGESALEAATRRQQARRALIAAASRIYIETGKTIGITQNLIKLGVDITEAKRIADCVNPAEKETEPARSEIEYVEF